jgi:threonine dehydrogenase-like Zn-dependent dehydrogenase
MAGGAAMRHPAHRHVAIWGAGPSGQMAHPQRVLLGAKQVVASTACRSGSRWREAAAPSPSTSRRRA